MQILRSTRLSSGQQSALAQHPAQGTTIAKGRRLYHTNDELDNYSYPSPGLSNGLQT
jgi:hypothetical protein